MFVQVPDSEATREQLIREFLCRSVKVLKLDHDKDCEYSRTMYWFTLYA